MKKKILAILLAIILVFSLSVTAFAAPPEIPGSNGGTNGYTLYVNGTALSGTSTSDSDSMQKGLSQNRKMSF